MDDFGHAIGLPSTGVGQASGTPPTPDISPTYGNQHPYEPHAAQPTAQADPDLAAAQAQARAQAEAGDLTGARTMIEEALAGGELRLGRGHPALVPVMVDLSALAGRLGNLTEAGNQLRRAYGIVVATDGPQHPTALSIEGRLAAVLSRLGESTEAYDWHLADAGRRVLGDDHPAVVNAQQRLAAVAPVAAPAAPIAAPIPIPEPPFAAPMATLPVRYEPPPAPVPYTPPPSVPAAPPPPAAPAEPLSFALVPREAGTLYGPALEGDIWDDDDATVRTRRPANGGVVLVASLGAVILIGGVVLALALLRSPTGPPTTQDTGPARTAVTVTVDPTPTVASSPAPTDVRIVEDGGGTVTLSWSDPSGGQVPFVVSAAREGDALTAIVTVPAGETTTTLYGFNVNFNYCFTVSAVWSAELVQESMRTCTHRLNVTPSPT